MRGPLQRELKKLNSYYLGIDPSPQTKQVRTSKEIWMHRRITADEYIRGLVDVFST